MTAIVRTEGTSRVSVYLAFYAFSASLRVLQKAKTNKQTKSQLNNLNKSDGSCSFRIPNSPSPEQNVRGTSEHDIYIVDAIPTGWKRDEEGKDF